jgi:8-oxo-dGTP pyrophosphatase MutT (NUDIX family)
MKHAVAILIEKDRRYLFVQRPPGDPFEGYWGPPTGKVEPGENQEQTVTREAMEELGIPVRPLKKVWECITTTGEYILHWWTVQPLCFDIKLNKKELNGYTWTEPENFTSLGKVLEKHVFFFNNLKKYI